MNVLRKYGLIGLIFVIIALAAVGVLASEGDDPDLPVETDLPALEINAVIGDDPDENGYEGPIIRADEITGGELHNSDPDVANLDDLN